MSKQAEAAGRLSGVPAFRLQPQSRAMTERERRLRDERIASYRAQWQQRFSEAKRVRSGDLHHDGRDY
jgi:hypothetical protein